VKGNETKNVQGNELPLDVSLEMKVAKVNKSGLMCEEMCFLQLNNNSFYISNTNNVLLAKRFSM
jgi:hypothetical protein